MSRHRPLLFTVRYCEKPFRGRHWYVSGFKGGKRIQLWFRSEKEAKAAAANRNAEIKAHGTQVSLSPVDRIQAIAAAEKLAPYGKSILEAVDFFVAHFGPPRLLDKCSGLMRTCRERIRAPSRRERNLQPARFEHAGDAKRNSPPASEIPPLNSCKERRLRLGWPANPWRSKRATGTWATSATPSGSPGNGISSRPIPSST